ncbi:long-chain acyl-CoA synthetase [Litorivivens lipolytica]|uniref:Long-chain acyl-CoA synthetase n=1 Tax=Litorivivens lipolytica TaxID=1524264 RepID=A0A7W4W353_9GAMM|nr:acyl-CoA synthetase [Litorivivens lipolytica]MBB3046581.1 long-chain acyl-CoA synthetase [Litorivivens lipolytica]
MSELGFWAFAQKDPSPLALVAPDGNKYTRGDLLAKANQVVHGLRELGLERGDAVAMMLPNCVEFYYIYLAATQAGFYMVPINWHLAGPEVAYILEDCEAKAFVSDQRVAKAASTAAEAAGFDTSRAFAVGDIPGFRSFDELVNGQPDTLPENRSAGQIMNYTSGTTGKPKGVKRPLPDMAPEDLYGMMAMFLMLFGIQPEDNNVHFCGSPLYHTAVLQFSGNSLHMGHAVVLVEKWDPEQTLKLIEEYKVTTSHMVPTQFIRMLKLPEEVRSRYDVSSTRHMIHAAAPCPPDIKRQMLDWWGNSIYEYYAGTEGGGTLCTPEGWLAHPGSVGSAWYGSEVKIYDDEGNELGPNQTGTIYMKLMDNSDFEYKGDTEKTKKNRIGNFFTLGDIGHLDEDGYLYLSDRKIDMIISGGANIYPAEIENVLILHDKVNDCAVFGVPNEDWGEEIKAVVQPIEGVEPSDALTEELMTFLEERLARMKLPRSIDYQAELPRDPNGKLYKRRLRDPYWEGHTRKV